jgi:hypothetical protein
MLEGMSPEEVAELPPFPFPRELFPPGARRGCGWLAAWLGQARQLLHAAAGAAAAVPAAPW